MATNITIASPFVRNACVGAAHAGFDVDKILLNCGIFPESLRHDRNRVPVDDFVNLMRRLMQLMDDELLGLSHKPLRYGSFALLARSAVHETRLIDAARVYVQSANLIDTGLRHEMKFQDAYIHYQLHHESASPLPNQYATETALLTVHRFLCWLGRYRIPVSLAELDYPAPEWHSEYRYLFYGAPVKFDSTSIALHLEFPNLNAPVRRNYQELLKYLAAAPRDIFTPLSNRLISQRVQKIITDCLSQGEPVPSIERCASQLEIPTHQLWRGLSRERTNYRTLRAETCLILAQSLLRESELSIDQIASRSGYSEASAFIRAFRQRTGMTPLAYRRVREI